MRFIDGLGRGDRPRERLVHALRESIVEWSCQEKAHLGDGEYPPAIGQEHGGGQENPTERGRREERLSRRLLCETDAAILLDE